MVPLVNHMCCRLDVTFTKNPQFALNFVEIIAELYRFSIWTMIISEYTLFDLTEGRPTDRFTDKAP